MTLQKAIAAKKKALTEKAKKSGLYEDFGQKEVRKLEDKYASVLDYSPKGKENRNSLLAFEEWCINYEG
jgi:hypothetical protein